jgi:hypothetical protein
LEKLTAKSIVCRRAQSGGTFSRRSFLGAGCVIAAAGMLSGDAAAENGSRVALIGYDPVSYFTAGVPERGTHEFTAVFDDAAYWFKSAEHQAMFVAEPDRYAPQYNAFCAVMVARGSKREAAPEAWAIRDGKVYVFAGKQGVPMFEQQAASILAKANEKWQELHNQP